MKKFRPDVQSNEYLQAAYIQRPTEMAKRKNDRGEKMREDTKKNPDEAAGSPILSLANLFGQSATDPVLEALFKPNVKKMRSRC